MSDSVNRSDNSCDTRHVDVVRHIEVALSFHTDTLKEHTRKIDTMSEKVFNGFGSTVEAVNTKLDLEIIRNSEDFRRVHDTLKSIIRFGAGVSVSILLALIGVIGSIWVSDRVSMREIQAIQLEQLRVERARTNHAENINESGDTSD